MDLLPGWKYQVKVKGEVKANGTAPIGCPTCHATRDLLLLANGNDRRATIRCPQGHQWLERSMDADVVIEHAVARPGQ